MRKPLVVLDWSTNAYQSADLGLNLPCATFTNHYHRGEGLTTEPGVYTQYGDHRDHLLQSPHGHHTPTRVATVITVDNDGAQWRTLKEGQNGGTQAWSVSKRFSEKIFLGRHAF